MLADDQIDDLSAAGEVYWPLTDPLGTVRGLVISTPDGTMIDKHRLYDSFGKSASSPCSLDREPKKNAPLLAFEPGQVNGILRRRARFWGGGRYRENAHAVRARLLRWGDWLRLLKRALLARGLTNDLYRWLDAGMGRWISQDPIGFAAGNANLYR